MYLEEKTPGEVQESSDWKDFLSWLKTKNPEEKYNWCSPWRCPASQYLDHSKKSAASCALFNEISYIAYRKPWTFGSLQKRFGL